MTKSLKILIIMAASFLLLNCGLSPEQFAVIFALNGNVDLDPKNQTLESINQVQQEGTIVENTEINTVVYQWYFGSLKAKFIKGYGSEKNGYKLIELELNQKEKNFPVSVMSVHLADPPDKIPEI